MLFQVRVVIYISLEVNAPSKLDEDIIIVTNPFFVHNLSPDF